MIQRIQSLYLLLAAIFSAILFLSPILETKTYKRVDGVNQEVNYTYDALGVTKINTTTDETEHESIYLIAILAGLAALVAFTTIFFFKHRAIQFRMTYGVVFLLVIGMVVTVVVIGDHDGFKRAFDKSFKFTLLSGLLGIVSAAMAANKIKKDSELVESSDRIR
ncbi:MAG: glucan phosphoethanolaminetransferase (alkaline phosphatase superfamily) [Sphingobacteriales bacterium]|jgi:glucan phosphoethanolaminetransferase (alkaline phosphatase superfamily)